MGYVNRSERPLNVKSTQDEAKLYERCKMFIEKHQIQCGEDIYQSDRVIEDAYSFISDICDIVGYIEVKDE